MPMLSLDSSLMSKYFYPKISNRVVLTFELAKTQL